MFFPHQLGRNLTAASSRTEYSWLPSRVYPYSLGLSASGSLSFSFGEEVYTVEEVAAHLLNFAKGLAQEAVDGTAVTETVLTTPSDATALQRRALLIAARIAGLPRPSLIHETSAAALQRALDLDLSGSNGTQNQSTVLYYNMGSRHVEACIVSYRGATHLGKSTVSMDVLGCGVSEELGGHHVDLLIAEKMLAAFQAKHAKLAEGIAGSARALRKLEKEAMGLKHVLSANREGQFRVESLYEDTDFAQPVTRETLEEWCSQLFSAFSQPIQAALALAGVTLEAVDTVEMVGGGWRIPKIQGLLSEYLESQRPNLPALNLSQHVNGDEAMATGAAFFGANSSVSFRTKRIFFTDSLAHRYALVIVPLNLSQTAESGWNRSVELFPAHSQLKSKKTVKLNTTFDLQASLLENGKPIQHWQISGIHEASTLTYPTLGVPLISLKFELDSSGVVQLSSATAIFDEPVAEGAAAAPGPANASAAAVEGNLSREDLEASAEVGSRSGEEQEPAPAEANASSNSNASSPGAGTGRLKIRKRKVPLALLEGFEGIHPRPLSVEEQQTAASRLGEVNAADAEVRRVDAAKNAFESYIYESREKLGADEGCQQVSTEEERGDIIALLAQHEEWLYEEEAFMANASTFEAKLEVLQKHVSPIVSRAFELEQRPLLQEKIGKVRSKVNATLEYVERNMTWVDAKEREGVANLSKAFDAWWANASENQSGRALTEEPAYRAGQVEKMLLRVEAEAMRLTKIKKIDPMPYSDYGGYGRGYGGYGGYDERTRAFYESMYRNFSKNGTNYSDWLRNFSNFSGFRGWNDSEYMRSYYEHAARNFSSDNASDSDVGGEASSSKTEL